MESLKDFKDFLRLPYFLANLIGLDPTQERQTLRFKLQTLVVTIAVVNHLYLMVFEIVYLWRNLFNFSSLLEATKTCAYIAYGVNTNTKIFAVLLDLQRLRSVLQIIESLFPRSYREKLAYRVNENFWPKSIYMVVGVHLIAGWANYFFPGIRSAYEYLRNEDEFSYETPFWVAHPFNYRTPLRYGLVYFSELWGGHLCVCSNLGVDMVLCFLSRQMSMHFKYIGQEIEGYRPTGNAEDSVFLAKLIERHQLILTLCSDLNEIFGISLVFNFLSCSGIICLTAFQVTFVGFGSELLKFILFLISVLGQLFIVCYCGDELITCSLSISESVYNHPWYRGSHSYRKLLVILILRCQKPATITAKGFSTVSLITFKKVNVNSIGERGIRKIADFLVYKVIQGWTYFQVTSISYKFFALLNTFHTAN